MDENTHAHLTPCATPTQATRCQSTTAPPESRSEHYRSRRSRIEKLRSAIQIFTLLVVTWIGVEFALWLHALPAGGSVWSRPPGVEGFLPISALISLRYWWDTGIANHIHPAGLIIFVLIVASGILLKKSFCSWLCPVGTISESLAAIGKRIFRRKLKLPRWLDYPLRSIKYLLLAFFMWAVLIQMTPKVIELFVFSPYNRVADIKMLHFFTEISPFALKVLLGLIAISVVIPYFWCRYLCPYGALLGALSWASPLKVTRDPHTCIDCELCARACPANLKVDRVKRVRSDECFTCLSCVAACPVQGALQLETPRPWRRVVRPLIFGTLVVVLFFGGIGAAKLAGYWHNDISEQEYRTRLDEIDSPKYNHAQGQVPEYGPDD